MTVWCVMDVPALLSMAFGGNVSTVQITISVPPVTMVISTTHDMPSSALPHPLLHGNYMCK